MGVGITLVTLRSSLPRRQHPSRLLFLLVRDNKLRRGQLCPGKRPRSHQASLLLTHPQQRRVTRNSALKGKGVG